jgi:hypothetical protein
MKVDDIPVASLEIPVSLHLDGTVPRYNQTFCTSFAKAPQVVHMQGI